VNGTLAHRHGPFVHRHHHHGPHRHVQLPFRSHESGEHGQGEHGHIHGLVDPSIIRSRAGLSAVSASLAVLAATAAAQVVVYVASGSVALLADLIHNAGDALTAIPLGIAFVLRSRRGERVAGYVVVGVILVSALVAGIEAVERLVHPETLDHLGALALAGAIGVVGNEVAAQIRLRAGTRLHSAALIADGHHARADGLVSLGVIASAVAVWIGLDRADPLIGLAMTAFIVRITWQAWYTIRDG
jgi:cation diffusion facilitator family transporter